MKVMASAILIGSIFAATQAALAASPFPPGAEGLRYSSEPPVSSTYQSEHPVSSAATSSDVPLGARELRERAEPAVRDTYQAQHAVNPGKGAGSDTWVANGFPPSEGEVYWQMQLPGTRQYLEARSAQSSQVAASPQTSTSGGAGN